MAKIYKSPIQEPQFDWQDQKAYKAKEDQFMVDLKTFLLERNPNGKNVGEVLRFSAADGHALYMVANMKPLQLVHLNLLDGYMSDLAPYLNAKGVQAKLDQQTAMDKLFSRK